MSFGSSDPQPIQQQTVQTTELPDYAQPIARNALNTLSQRLNSEQSYFPGQTYANLSPEQQRALSLTSARALNGSPLLDTASRTISGIASQDPTELISNSVNSAIDSASRNLLPGINSAFASGGRTGSGLAAQAQADVLGSVATNAVNSLLPTIRSQQLQAASLLPGLANQDYVDYGNLFNVGAQRQSLNQNEINDSINRFNFNQQNPIDRARALLSAATGVPGGTITSSSSQPLYRNTGAGILGGASSGAGIADQFGLGGIGQLLSAGFGGLLGGFF